MLILNCEITIGEYKLDFVNEIAISRSVDELTQGGTITLPKNVIYKKNNQIVENVVRGEDAIFKRGDAVEIKVGYKPKLTTVFNGYVSRINARFPLVFEVEDEMFKLKQLKVEKYNRDNVNLEDFLSDILPAEYADRFNAADVNLGNVRAAKPTTIGQMLSFLKDNYGLSVYFDSDGVLQAGFAFPDLSNVVTTSAKVFEFGRNIIDDSGLEYQRAEDQLLRIKAVSIYPDNTRVEVNIGDDEGEQRSFYAYNVSQASLTTLATEQLSRLKYEGVRGSFLTFTEPVINVGDVIELKHKAFPDYNGFYLVRAINTNFGVNGGRQEIELEIRVE